MKIVPAVRLPATAGLAVVAVGTALLVLSPTSVHRAAGAPSATDVSATQEDYPRIVQLNEFRKILASHESVIVDARPEDEYGAGHVPGAVNVPRYKVVVSADEVVRKLPKDRALTLYCGSSDCEDARMEARALRRLGYSQVSVFRGGMKEWRQHRLPEDRTTTPAQNVADGSNQSR